MLRIIGIFLALCLSASAWSQDEELQIHDLQRVHERVMEIQEWRLAYEKQESGRTPSSNILTPKEKSFFLEVEKILQDNKENETP